jgi:hypothetical protein
MNQARAHHYLFAHRVLPSVFFENPARFIEVLAKDGIGFLRFFWERVGSDLKDETALPASGLNYQTRRTDDGVTVVIITLPQPEAAPEAYFAAAVYRPPMEGGASLCRYFTLEYGIDLTGSQSRTVLCEWTSQPSPSHLNYGDGPEATEMAFFKAVCEKLEL